MVYNQTTGQLDARIRLVGQQESGPVPTGIFCQHSDFRGRNQTSHTDTIREVIKQIIDWERSILQAARLLSEADKLVTVDALLFARALSPTFDVIKVAGAFASLSIRFSFRKPKRSTDHYGSIGITIRIGNRLNQNPLPTGVYCLEREWVAYQMIEREASRLIHKLNTWQVAIQTVTQAMLIEETKVTPHLIHERALVLLKSNPSAHD